MTNQELHIPQKTNVYKNKKPKRLPDFGVCELVEYVFLLLLNKIYLFGALSPFGISFFAATFPKQRRKLAFLAVVLGLISSQMGLHILKYAGAYVITGAAFLLFSEELTRSKGLHGAVAAISLLISGTAYVVTDGFLLYDFLFLILECILVFLLYFAFEKSAVLLRGIKQRKTFEPVEGLALVLLCACVILGLKTFPYFEGGAHVLSMVVIFITALTGGFPLSCAAGVTLGLVNSLSDVLPAQTVGVYAIASLCAGLLRKRGRWGVVLGFFCANAASAIYFSHSTNTVISFYHVVLSGIILFLLPNGLLQIFGEVIKSSSYEEASVERLRDIMSEKLSSTAESFSELSDLFGTVVAQKIASDMHDPGALFDRTAEAVCKDCTLMPYCWQKEYNNTRRSLLHLYDKMEIQGCANENNMPAEFKHACIRLEEFIKNLNKSYELHKVNQMWASRVSESRQLAIQQFENISMALRHMQKELTEAPIDMLRLERKVLAALDRIGIVAQEVRISGGDALKVSFETEACGGKRVCADSMELALGNALGVPMHKMPTECGDKRCRLTFCERVRFTVETGIAQVSGQFDKPSGDNHLITHSGDGKYVLALSDGMGQGQEADNQSRLTVHLIKKLLQSGFDKETAMRLINSMLMVNSDKENFATADLCLVNLYSGGLEFIKIGATSSYVKHRDQVERVQAGSLPVGLISEPETQCDLKYAVNGDFVIMVTDGITDVLETEKENRLTMLIASYLGKSPQQLADEIARAAMVACKGEPLDDMTVLVARITEE